jgi:hypothetical protein
MTPRWSRLALAAILAFGVCPVAEAAAAVEEDGRDAVCPCERDPAVAPSLLADADHPLFRAHPRHASPVCSAPPVAILPRADAELLPLADARVSSAAAGPRHAPWRLAPKTSPPVR